ncbi:MAG TPA: ComEC/Rec2 family competence protein, partial [Capsulimonadaceae bacterium]|nr:ComEC/Rec2 family competence protein [Capsulimonadaceae bacterium]
YFGALLFKRVPDLPISLAVAALVVLWLQPTAVFEPAFQMSFITVLGLILLMPIWADLWEGLEKRFRRKWARITLHRAIELVGLSFIAQLSAAPVVAVAYNQFSVLGFFANLCVVPALFLLIPAGFFASLLGVASPIAAGVVFKLVASLLHYIVATVTFFAALPGCSFSVRPLSLVAILAYYGLLYGVAIALKAVAHRRAGHRSEEAPKSTAGQPASPLNT